MSDGIAVFATTAGDDLVWSEIVEDQNQIVNYGHSIFQESTPLFLHLVSPQHSELVPTLEKKVPEDILNTVKKSLV